MKKFFGCLIFGLFAIFPVFSQTVTINGQPIDLSKNKVVVTVGETFSSPVVKNEANTSYYSVNGANFIGMNLLNPVAHMPPYVSTIRASGVTWLAIEPTKGKYDWNWLDAWAAAAAKKNVPLEYVILNPPVWARTQNPALCAKWGKTPCMTAPDDADWKEWITVLATRYKGKIKIYELWNEANTYNYFVGTPQQMAHLASIAYPIIKSIDPQAIVLTPSVAYGGWPLSYNMWLDQYFAAGGYKYADGVAWHGYLATNDTYPAEPVEHIQNEINAIKFVLTKYRSELPIWDTEGGYGKNVELAGSQNQANFLAKWYLMQLSEGISHAYWYQYDNSLWGTLRNSSGSLTLAGQAYNKIASFVKTVTGATPCTFANNIYSCNFKTQSGTETEWIWADKTTSLTIPSQFTSATTLSGGRVVILNHKINVGLEPVWLQ